MEWASLEGADLKSRLDEQLSPQFERLGLIWRGDYHWVEMADSSSRRVVKFQLLKGLSAVLAWGLSLNFVPTVSGGRLSYHRTFKSASLDLFEGTHAYASGCAGPASIEKMSLRIDGFDRSLADYMSEVLPVVVAWFDRMRNLDDIAVEAVQQMRVPSRGGPKHHPSAAYVLAFVRAAQGEVEAGRETLKNAIGQVDDDLWRRLEKALEGAKARMI